MTIQILKNGARQSALATRWDLLDPAAMQSMAKTVAEGSARYGDNNWRLIPVESHLNHLIEHVYAYLRGDQSEDHLSHALCRAMFALAVHINEPPPRVIAELEAYAKGRTGE